MHQQEIIESITVRLFLFSFNSLIFFFSGITVSRILVFGLIFLIENQEQSKPNQCERNTREGGVTIAFTDS